MALEVLRGRSATVASDQFALAVTMHEVLAGKRPFAGQTWAELAQAIERGAIAPLRSVPGWLDAAIRRSLAADPARRFPSLAALADHLAERAQRRRPAVWIAGAATAAVLASGVTWFVARGDSPAPAAASCELGATEIAGVWSPLRRDRLTTLDASAAAAIDRWTALWSSERDATCAAARLEAAPTNAARQRCLDQQRAQLAALLDRAATPRVADRARTSTRFDHPELASDGASIADRMLDALAALSPSECRLAAPGTADPLPLDPDRALAVRTVERELPAVRAAIALGDTRPVVEASAALVERARTAGHAPTLAEALLARADTLRANAQLADAALAARDAVAAAERGHDDQTAARAWVARVMLAGDRRDLAAAEDLAEMAAAAIDRAGAPPRLVAQLLRLRALVAYNRGRLDEVRTLLAEARAKLVAISGERSVEVAAIESSLGSTARAAGDLDIAEQHHRNALAIDRALRGDRHPDIARDLHNIAGVLRLRGDLDRAFATYHEALTLEIAMRGAHSVEAGLTYNSLALVKMARRDWAGARVDLELARAILDTAGHGDRAFAEHNLGLVAAATGDHRAALDHYQRAATIYHATIGEEALAPIRLHLDRARSLARRQAIEAARTDARRALDAAKRADIPWIAEDAQAFLDGTPVLARADRNPPARISVEPPPPSERPVTQPQLAAEPKPPDPPPVLPDRRRPPRDVGTYGSSQGW
jgi:tetratricopeptide (TPR) repeat protein